MDEEECVRKRQAPATGFAVLRDAFSALGRAHG